MTAAESLEPRVLRPLSSPNSPDDLWPEPQFCSKKFISWRPASGRWGPAPCLPAWLPTGMAGTELGSRGAGTSSLALPESQESLGTTLAPRCHLRRTLTQSKHSATLLPPFLCFLERSCFPFPLPGSRPNLEQPGLMHRTGGPEGVLMQDKEA